MAKSPDIAIHVLGELHSESGIEHLPNIHQKAQDFFFPGKGKKRAGRNIWIGESYGMSPEVRAAIVRNSQNYPPLETFLRAAYWKVEDQMDPQVVNSEVALKMLDRYSPRWSGDYHT